MSKQIQIFVLLTFVCLVYCIQQGKFYVGKKSMVQLVADSEGKFEDCAVFTNSPTIDNILKDVPSANVIVKDETSMKYFVMNCNKLHQQLTTSNVQSKRRISFPGTKWCGIGNTKIDYDDLGVARNTDACCRDHYHCAFKIPAFSYRFGIFNLNLFTVSDCECDKVFNTCLKDAKYYDLTADIISAVHFNNWFGVDCIRSLEMSIIVFSKETGRWRLKNIHWD